MKEFSIILVGLMSMGWLFLLSYEAWKVYAPFKKIVEYRSINDRARGHELNPFKDREFSGVFHRAVQGLRAEGAKELIRVEHGMHQYQIPLDAKDLALSVNDTFELDYSNYEVIKLDYKISGYRCPDVWFGYGPQSRTICYSI